MTASSSLSKIVVQMQRRTMFRGVTRAMGALASSSSSTNATFQPGMKAATTTTNNKSPTTWSGQLSFTSPEADFTSYYVPNTLTDSDRSRLVQLHNTTPAKSSSILSSFLLSIAGQNKAAASAAATHVPKTFKEALQSHKEAIVVTTATAPFTILYVNEAWEKMCGYTSAEVVDQTLECIQGPETNITLATSSVKLLVADQQPAPETVDPIDMYLINYKKDGSAFTNHLTIGTMTLNEESDEPHFLVGVLEEVSPDQVPLRMI